jgi:hypothetical protein
MNFNPAISLAVNGVVAAAAGDTISTESSALNTLRLTNILRNFLPTFISIASWGLVSQSVYLTVFCQNRMDA